MTIKRNSLYKMYKHRDMELKDLLERYIKKELRLLHILEI